MQRAERVCSRASSTITPDFFLPYVRFCVRYERCCKDNGLACNQVEAATKGVFVTISLDRMSVIVPTRNEANNVPAFLASLPPAVELIVVDNSDDGTDQLIQHLRPARTRIIHSPVTCISHVRQIGAEAAKGDWLIFSDADVMFALAYFDALATCSLCDACYGPKYATPTYAFYGQFFASGQRLLHQFGIPAASGSSMSIRRAVFERVGGFRLDLPVNEDTELMMRLRYQGFTVNYVHELAVYSLDDRRLDQGIIRKTLHSLCRNILLLVDMRLPLPRGWLAHDWGYWRKRSGRTISDG